MEVYEYSVHASCVVAHALPHRQLTALLLIIVALISQWTIIAYNVCVKITLSLIPYINVILLFICTDYVNMLIR